MSLFFNRDPLDIFYELEIGGQKVATDNDKNEDNSDYTAEEKNNTPAIEDLKPADPAGETTDYTADDSDVEKPIDKSEEPSNDTPDTEPSTDNNTDSPGDDSNQTDDEGGTTDYTADDPSDDQGTADDTEDGGDTSDDNADDGESSGQSDDSIKQLEDELFSSLSPEQMTIKHKELKIQFSEMYNVVNTIITRINDMPKDEEFVNTVEFISNKLSELKDMLTDYVMDVYETKSYMENAIAYNKFLATLNGVNRVLEKITFKDGK